MFKTVAQYLGYTRKFELLTDVPVHWPNNAGPTLNKPKCGFVGELCISHGELFIQTHKTETLQKDSVTRIVVTR